jgi:hypothetical protein
MRRPLEMLTSLMFLAVVSATSLLNQEQLHMLQCVERVLERNFVPGTPLLVSVPTSPPQFNQRSFVDNALRSNEHNLADAVLENINKKSRWPILTARADTSIPDDNMPYKHNSYVIFLWTEAKTGDVLESLESQMENIQAYAYSWNRRGRYFVFVTDLDIQHPQQLAVNISQLLWTTYSVMNVLIMISNKYSNGPEINSQSSHCVTKFYTWFPYESGKCGQVENVSLLDKWILGENKNSNLELFPEKVPRNLHQCPIKVYANEFVPHIMPVCNTEAHGNGTCTLRGTEMEYIYLVGKAMNLNLDFLKLPQKGVTETYLEGIQFVLEGKADVLMGVCPLHYLLINFLDPTVPYTHTAIKWYVPCAGQLPRIGNILDVFDKFVWFATIIISLLTALLFWTAANLSSYSGIKESNTYKLLHNNFYNVWSILLGQSVPKLPLTSQLRCTFFLFLCFCFAMNTVFQALFISYLVEPGYEKQIESFDEMKDSGILFAKHGAVDFLSSLVNRDDIQKVRSPVETCSVFEQCVLRLIHKRDIITLAIQSYAEYVASKAGINLNGKKSLCSIQENFASVSSAMYLSKGNPLLDKFNVYIQRSLEGGLGEKYVSEMAWNESLRKRSKSPEQDLDNEDGDTYFIFTIFHLKFGVYLLLFGYVLSSAVFVCELSSKCLITRFQHHT